MRRFIVIVGFLVVFIISAIHVSGESGLPKDFSDPINIGTPLKSIATLDTAFGFEDGREVMYTTATGDPAIFNVIDIQDNELIRSIPLPGATNSWAHTTDLEGNVYISGTKKMFRYSPETKEISDLGVALSSESSIWSLTSDEEGNVYGGTFPNGKVFKYDPVENEFTDYGTMVDGQEYVRSISYKDGIVYAGIGSTGSIMKLDVETKEKSELELRSIPDVAQYSFVYGLDIREDLLFVYLNNANNPLIIYDLKNETWLDEVYYNYGGLHISPIHNGKVSFVQNNKLMFFDLETHQVEDTGASFGTSLRNSAWVEIENDSDLPGHSLVTIQYGGNVTILNPTTGKVKKNPPVIDGQPIDIHSLENGPDDNLYMTGYMGATGANYNPETDIFSNFPIGQAESIGSYDDKMYFGVYPGARIYEFDVTKDEDPKELFEIGEDQDRPYVQATGDDKLFFGTIPDYGHLGGALSVYDLVTKSHETYRNVVQNQSIVGLTYKEGKIYGSTTIHGGLGISPTETAAKLFIWDTEKGKKVTEFTPDIPGLTYDPIMISGLTFGPDNLLWGAAEGAVFAMDPETQGIVKSKVIYPDVTGYGMWRPIHIRTGEDGLLYTDLYGKLTVINPETMDHEELGIDTQLMTLDKHGDIYYVDKGNLKKIEVNDLVTLDSFEKEVIELYGQNRLPHSLYKKITNQLNQTRHHQEKGREKQANHHLKKITDHVEKWHTVDEDIKQRLLDNLDRLSL